MLLSILKLIIILILKTQLSKFLSVQNRLPKLKALICYNDSSVKTDTSNRVKVYTWEDFMNLGTEVPPEFVNDRIKGQSPGEVCTLIYTSGTTGMYYYHIYIYITAVYIYIYIYIYIYLSHYKL